MLAGVVSACAAPPPEFAITTTTTAPATTADALARANIRQDRRPRGFGAVLARGTGRACWPRDRLTGAWAGRGFVRAGLVPPAGRRGGAAVLSAVAGQSAASGGAYPEASAVAGQSAASGGAYPGASAVAG